MFEREAFEIFIQLTDLFTINKAIKLNLKDYPHEKSVDILKITTKDNLAIIVISDTLTY